MGTTVEAATPRFFVAKAAQALVGALFASKFVAVHGPLGSIEIDRAAFARLIEVVYLRLAYLAAKS